MSDQTFTVTVTGYGASGEGVARLPDGRVVFIRGTARDDVCEVRLTQEQSRVCRGEIARVLSPSPHRIEPDCAAYPRCGGCDYRHISYKEELWAKGRRVNDALLRIGGLDAQVDEVLSTGQTDGYRNKAVLRRNAAGWGFYASGSHEVVPFDRCLLLNDELNAAKSNLPANGGEVTLRCGKNGLCVPIEEELDGLAFQMSPKSFFQVNLGAALLLYKKARAYAALSKNETLVDLYCGIGSVTLFLGRDAGAALGVENNPAAVADAWANAQRNGLPHIEFLCADAAEWGSPFERIDCITVDPPRKGLSPKALRKLLDLAPKRIVYISCDPATLARDIRLLHRYAVRRICAVDMFPRTANVECCCLLEQA